MKQLEPADIQTRERLRRKKKIGELSEEMEPYLSYLEGNRSKESHKWFLKLRNLLRTLDHSMQDVSDMIGNNASVQSLKNVRNGHKGVLSESSCQNAYYAIRKRVRNSDDN